MLFAIRLTWHDWCATEIKPFSSRLAFRPRAHSRAKCRQSNNLGWFWFLLDGRSAFRQPQPMYFPYNCVLGHPKAISDLTSGEAFVPKGDQRADAFRCPFLTPFFVIRLGIDAPRYSQPTRTYPPCLINYSLSNPRISKQISQYIT